MHIFLAVFILVLTPPLAGVAIVLFDLAHPPRQRCILAFGSVVLLMAFSLGSLGASSAVLDGRQPFFPYLVVAGLPAVTVARMMHIELYRPTR